MSNISKIKNLRLIQYAQEVIFDKKLESQLKKLIPKDWLVRAKKNSTRVSVYRINYTSNNHLVAGFIIEPRNIKGKVPAIIVNRGGNREFADIRLGRVFTELAELAMQGYVLFVSQLSGHPTSEGKDEYGGSDLNDILVFHKMIKSHPNIDGSKIGMFGWSRGGMMTYLALAKVKWVKAVVCIAGLANMVRQAKLRSDMIDFYKKTFGGTTTEYQKRSVLFWPEKISKKIPILMMHGTSDWRVSVLDSLELSQKFYEQKVPHRLIVFEAGDHGLTEYRNEVFRQTVEWFERFLKNGEKMPNLKLHGE